MSKMTTTKLIEMKKNGEKITALTCYSYSMAKILNECGIDILLVGDSLGMVVLGYENTIPVSVSEMLHHTKAVKRGNTSALLVVDMPFMSFETSKRDAIKNAGILVKEGGAEAVKIEGGKEMSDTIKAIINANIPVMGHIGLTPQSIHKLGGYKVQGKTEETKNELISDAKILEDAGVFSIVLECVPKEVAKEITESVSVPTIGIGAGPFCDGQVLVIDDMLGLYSDISPKFVKRYTNLKKDIFEAIKKYKDEVKEGKFPSEEHCYK